LVRKRIGWFRKQLGKLGKRLIRKRYRKIDLYVLSLMELEVVRKYGELLGDQGQGFDVLDEQFTQGAYDLFYSLQNMLKIFFSKSLEDLTYLYDLALYVILGDDYKIFFDTPKLVTAEESEDGIPKLITRVKKCILCASADEGDIKLDELAHRGFGEILGHAVAALMQITQDYVGNNYDVITKETKCFLRGDAYGELTMFFYPKKEEGEVSEKEENPDKSEEPFEENIDWDQ